MKLSVGRLSKMFKISRTALLYYDKIGLLHPASRSESGYRLYEQNDAERLSKILTLRDAGVPLNQIGCLIQSEEPVVCGRLIKRLGELNSEIDRLKNRQQRIISFLKNTLIAKSKDINSQTIEKIIEYAEIDSGSKNMWHIEFEKQSPEQHEHFLSMLGFSDDEIRAFRMKLRRETGDSR